MNLNDVKSHEGHHEKTPRFSFGDGQGAQQAVPAHAGAPRGSWAKPAKLGWMIVDEY